MDLLHKNLRNKAEIIVGLGNWCNYDCSYCMPHSKSRTMQVRGGDQIVKVIEQSYTHFKSHANVDSYGVMFVGGEPTIHPDFLHIIDSIQHLRQKDNYHILLVTNFSRTEKWWAKHATKFTSCLASYHDEHTSIDEFTTKLAIAMTANKNLIITVGIQPLPGKLNKLADDCRQILFQMERKLGKEQCDEKLDFLIQHLYTGVNQLFPYADQELEQFKQMMTEFNNPNISEYERLGDQQEFITHSFSFDDEFLGSKCYVGVESMTVGFDGRLNRTARCGLSKEQSYLGNIFGEYRMPVEPAICDYAAGCGNCWFDYATKKIRVD